MSRALVLGNGETLVCLDKFGFVRDFYFPYVGLENHVSGHRHRIGVMVDGVFSWLNDGSWEINVAYKPQTMVGYLVCKNKNLGLSLVMEDIVYNETNVFLRKVEIYNSTPKHRDIKIFFHQVFLISENNKRNTAFYDPTHNAVVHYKGRRVFIVNGRTGKGNAIDDFSVGAYHYENKEGTYKDAEDGVLGKNGVEHGSVDSVVRFCVSCEGNEKSTVYYWICAGKSLDEAYQINQMVMTKTPQAMVHSTTEFWHAWLNKREIEVEFLTPEQQKLFHTSLFLLRAHADNRGAIIASADSAMIEYGKDDYAYMWPRDAAFIVSVLDNAGFTEVTEEFFKFCKDVLHPDGYLHHRFNADKSLGSTWHSSLAQKEWLKDRKLQLPIQEDETASVLFALWNHYFHTKDIELIEELYKPFIEKMAEFLVDFRNQETGLPIPSYDLWEEKIGVSTYTCASVYGGLMAAAKFCELLGKRDRMRKYRQTAQTIKKAVIDQLYSPELKSFVRVAYENEQGQLVQDQTIDASSLYGLWHFGMFTQDDELFKNTQQAVMDKLKSQSQVGGFIRYQNDQYFRRNQNSNPWFITTLWEVQRRLAQPQVSPEDIEYAHQQLQWVVDHMYQSGILAEQLDPDTGESLSATPLVWSHAEYVQTVLMLKDVLNRKGKLGTADSVNQLHEL